MTVGYFGVFSQCDGNLKPLATFWPPKNDQSAQTEKLSSYGVGKRCKGVRVLVGLAEFGSKQAHPSQAFGWTQ